MNGFLVIRTYYSQDLENDKLMKIAILIKITFIYLYKSIRAGLAMLQNTTMKLETI